ncbi:MAG: glycosyltransferase family 4 protein [Chthonomonadales bacterium]|nr:glycosyltransferase family 4 protein [Chthonomonadales bacterium]
MRIGIDGRALTGRFTGDRTYWRNLVRAHLRAAARDAADGHEYIVYTRLPVPAGELPQSPYLSFRTVPATNNRLWTLLAFPRAMRHDGIDVAHTQYTIPLRAACPVVTTVHDISFRLYPEWFPRKHRVLLNLTVPCSMRRARVVITDSESSRRDILRVYGFEPGHVTAIALAAGPEYRPMPRADAAALVAEHLGLDSPYVVTVGVLQPRKNLPLLLEAFARARMRAEFPHKLVLAGKRGWGCENLAIQAARLQIGDAAVFTDYVADQDLPALYSAADAMAFPSLYEGFGLPPLEAMACGAPTLVSDAPAMPEVVGDGAMILPVMDAYSWGDALAALLKDPAARRTWSARGVARAAAFDWDRTARATRQVYGAATSRQAAAAG